MSTTMSPPEQPLVDGLAEPLQVLDPTGSRHPCPPLDEHLGDVDENLLTDLYIDMAVIRRIDHEAVALQRQGELGLWPPLLGQEAAQIGLGRALAPTDFIFSSYREHGLAWCRGVIPSELLSVWRGTTFSGWDPHERHMATPQIIIGAQALHATGYAMATAAQGGQEIAVACFGDGATSEGDVNEAMVFAATFDAPVVFFCQNNQYAISEPVTVQTTVPIALRPTGFGIPALRVDGNDVLAVRAASLLAARRARAGGGPTFIEAVTYRMGAHTTSDDPTRYRDDAELERWQRRCPVRRLERHLEQLGAPVASIREEATVRADAVAAELRQAVTTMAPPEPQTLFDHVYTGEHPTISRQRAAQEAFAASLAEEQP
ncbi:thiamine pyrophosphate-dependent enzyme [Georgenia sp. H159]|uniref:thiamine pyrophosphate-dependent enzyme n=1 Tax=Georgenia sp. H159 TaxID=3076115 RepID=UPI002D79CB7B|nr:thiamine pyrophosphate-dependent enzyme [Georgenia sp. H159]